MVAHLSLGGDNSGVVVGTEAVESGAGFRKELPDDPEDGSGRPRPGLEFAAAFGNASVAFAEEGIGLGGRGGGLAKRAFEVGVALAGLAAAAARPGPDGARAEFGPGDEVLGGGKAAMSKPISAMIVCVPRGPIPGMSSSRSMTLGASSATAADSTRVGLAPPMSAPRPVPGPLLSMTPAASGSSAINSSMRAVRVSIWAESPSIWPSSIRANSP